MDKKVRIKRKEMRANCLQLLARVTTHGMSFQPDRSYSLQSFLDSIRIVSWITVMYRTINKMVIVFLPISSQIPQVSFIIIQIT